MPMVTRHLLRRRVRAALSSFEAAALLFGLSVPALHAQRREVAARIVDSTDTNSEAVDTGQVPVSQPMRLTLRLAPTPERQAALDQLLAGQAKRSSAAYHRWITPQQFAATYGATDDQINAIGDWLQSQGLTVQGVSS